MSLRALSLHGGEGRMALCVPAHLPVAVQAEEEMLFFLISFTVDLIHNLKFMAHVKACVPVTEATKFQVSAKEWCGKVVIVIK